MHEIRILKPNGEVKKVISSKKASELYWDGIVSDVLSGCVTNYKKLRKCKGCPKEFMPEARQQKFCNVKCQLKFYRKIQKRKRENADSQCK
jgi:hypothetical protein